MATFVLIPGAGSTSWYWHLVVPELRAAGHDVVAVDLPCDDDTAGLGTYVDTVIDSVGHATDLTLVAQSMAGFTVPLVCERIRVDLVVLVAAMVPSPGESGSEWWVNTRHDAAMREAAMLAGRKVDEEDEVALFLHDVPAELVAVSAGHVKNQSGTPFIEPWPLRAWPDVATRFLLCRDDRFFPAEFQRRVVRERLGITPDEMDGGHLPALARPRELAGRLLAYRAEWESTKGLADPTARGPRT